MLTRRKGPKEVVSAFAGVKPDEISKRSDHFAYLADKVFIPYGVKDKAREDYSANLLINDTNREFAQVVSEVGASGAAYTYGTERLQYEHLNKTQTYLTDGRGSVTELVSGGSNIDARYSYDALGTPSVTGKTYNPYTYNAEYTDATTGLQYLRARYLDFSTSRFVTQDTYLGDVVNPLTQNLYSYVSNNPVNLIDPTGHLGMPTLASTVIRNDPKQAYNYANQILYGGTTPYSSHADIQRIANIKTVGDGLIAASKGGGGSSKNTPYSSRAEIERERKERIIAQAEEVINRFRRPSCDGSVPKASEGSSINKTLVGEGLKQTAEGAILFMGGLAAAEGGISLVAAGATGEAVSVGGLTIPAGAAVTIGAILIIAAPGAIGYGAAEIIIGTQKVVHGFQGKKIVPGTDPTEEIKYQIIKAIYDSLVSVADIF